MGRKKKEELNIGYEQETDSILAKIRSEGIILSDANRRVMKSLVYDLVAKSKLLNDEWRCAKTDPPKSGELVIVANDESEHNDDNWVCCGYKTKRGSWYNQFEYPKTDVPIRVTL